MNVRSIPFSRQIPRDKRRGMTLIELLAGLVILGTVLATMVVARGRLTRQWAQADRKIEAARALDHMLAIWTDAPAFPVPASGSLIGTKNCQWRTQWISDPAAAKLGAAVARVEVFDPLSGATPILTIELLIHKEPPRRLPPATTRSGGAR